MPRVILTVDDSTSIRKMVSFTLEKVGYDVLEAANGMDAVRQIEGNNVHMMITDLNMPGMDGIQLIKSVRSNPKNKYMPIVMLTTESQQDKVLEGKAAGVTGWIIKPFKPDQLVGVVKKVLK